VRVDDLEVRVALVDVGREHRDAHRARVGDRADDLVDLVLVARHDRAEELDRVVRLQVRRLVRDERVRGRVALVEAVAREVLEQPEDALGVGLATPFFFAPRRGSRLLLRHLLGLLLAHRAAEQIGAAERVARERLGDLHDLLLVDDDAVRRHEQLVDERVHLRDRLARRSCG
jgi:hypothetical protein